MCVPQRRPNCAQLVTLMMCVRVGRDRPRPPPMAGVGSWQAANPHMRVMHHASASGAPAQSLLFAADNSHSLMPALSRAAAMRSVCCSGHAPSGVPMTAPLYDKPARAAAPV